MINFWRGLKLIITSSFRASPRVAAIGLTFEPLGVILSTFAALYYKWLVDGVTANDTAAIRNSAIGIAALSLVGMLLRFVGWPMRTKLLEETGAWLDGRLLDLQSSMWGLEHTERPEYHDRLESVNGSNFANSIMYIVGVVASLGRILLLIGMLASIYWPLALLPLFGVPSVFLGIKAESRGTKAWLGSRPLWRKADSFYELSIGSGPAKELRVFGLQDEARRVHRTSRAEGTEILHKANLISALWTSFGWLIFAAGYLGALALVALRTRRGEASLGDLVLAITASSQMNGAVSGFAEEIRALTGRLWSAQHFLWLEDEAKKAVVVAQEEAPISISEGIRFENVSFVYPGTEQTVLEDVNLFLPAGSRVAIVGDNGAGKTTLVKLLASFYRPTSGRILVDDKDLALMDPSVWRERLSAGFQDYCRFELRAARTVGIGDLPAIDEYPAIESALSRAGASDVPGKLVNGLDTQLGKSFDEGVDLSMGQWQKLALGRAFMRENPLLLVLDEPTSSLDAPTEHALFSRYAAVAEERIGTGGITILVSHRFSTVRTADLIIVVEGGQVREVGTHADLMKKEGLYAELFTMQASAYK